MSLANQPARSCPKSKSLYNQPQKPTQRQLGAISAKVRKKVNNRTLFAPVECCERCLRNRNGYIRLELAHIDSRRSINHLTEETDLLRLCGPVGESGTCHDWCHKNGEVSKLWMKAMQNRMREDAK